MKSPGSLTIVTVPDSTGWALATAGNRKAARAATRTSGIAHPYFY